MKKQKGAVLIVAMIILVMLTLLATAGMQLSALENRMAGNMQEMVRSFQHTETGLSEAESDFMAAPGPLTGTTMFGTEYDVMVWSTDTMHAIYLASAMHAAETTRMYLRHIDIPFTVDGTIACYGSCDLDLIGNAYVDGRDHDPPADFNCNGASCEATLTVGGTIPGVYQHTGGGSVDLVGSPTLEGSPPVQTGGGAFTGDDWIELVSILMDHASGWNGSAWGTRNDPIIHVYDTTDTINSNIDGAGVLVITAPEVTINGSFHFEGLIIMANPGGVLLTLGGGTDICGAVVATSPSTIDVGGAGTPRITYCSSALDGAAGVDAVSRLGWFHE
jgi:hypothetical protein